MALQGRIVIYSVPGCPHCNSAKSTLSSLELPYTDINLEKHLKLKRELVHRTGKQSVPQIFFNHIHIGGNTELQKLVKDEPAFQKVLKEVRNNIPPPGAPQLPEPGPSADEEINRELDECIQAVKELRVSGLIQDHRLGLFTVHKKTVLGSELVDWVMETRGIDRAKALELCQRLFQRHFLRAVNDNLVFCDSNICYRLLEDEESSALNTGQLLGYQVKSAVHSSEDLRSCISTLYSTFLSPDGKNVDYTDLARSPEFEGYINLARGLQRMPVEQLSSEERLAFFINIYNTMVIHATILLGPPTNIWQRFRFFNSVQYIIGGHNYSLQDIENGVLRGNQRGVAMFFKPFRKDDPRYKIALEPCDPRIHFTLVCGAKSCPVIRTYCAKNIDSELRYATECFIEDPAGCHIVLNKKEVWLSQIFKWYQMDFGNTEEEVVHWIYKNMAEGKKKESLEDLISGKIYHVYYLTYDWNLNSK